VGPQCVVMQIGDDKIVDGHHKGRNKNVDKSIVEEMMLNPKLGQIDSSKTKARRVQETQSKETVAKERF
jgi:hypothetical protein